MEGQAWRGSQTSDAHLAGSPDCVPADHCHWHNRDEPWPAYRLCGECYHGYATEADLLDEHNSMLRDMAKFDLIGTPTLVTDVDLVYSCPLCSHDW